MVVFQDGRLKEVVNLQVSELAAEEIAFVKARMDDWGAPIAPLKPPKSDDWDATQVQGCTDTRGNQARFDGQVLVPGAIDLDPPEEAPQREEVPENPRIRIEEILETGNKPVASRAEKRGSKPQQARSHGTAVDAIGKNVLYLHAAMTMSEVSSDRNATYASSDLETTTATTDIPQSDIAADQLEDSDDDDDDFIVGPSWLSDTLDLEQAPLAENIITETAADNAEDDGDDEHTEDALNDKPRRRRRRRRKALCFAGCWEPLPRAASARTPGQHEHDVVVDEDAESDLLGEPGARVVTEAEVRNSTGAERAQWKMAAEKEVQESFYAMGAVSETTPQELAAVGGQSGVLPMKAVWTRKSDGLCKNRGCVCGNFVTKDPTEQVWTAQAETSSVMSGLRLAQIRRWNIYKLVVKGAFMYAPLPEDMLIVVRPPKIWVTLGLVKPDVLWTLRRAVYGLRCAPRAWGLERDRKLREATWKSEGKTYRLKQCMSDSQVWRIL